VPRNTLKLCVSHCTIRFSTVQQPYIIALRSAISLLPPSFTPMQILRDIDEHGWASVPGIQDTSALIKLARSLGKPLRNGREQIVSELRVMPNAAARPFTLSSVFGTGSFPLHTDTAFWRVPARFLVMRANGDLRRSTTVCHIRALAALAGGELTEMMMKSIWTLRKAGGSRYCQMALSFRGRYLGYRYDGQCMAPANESARKVETYISAGVPTAAVHEIAWRSETAVVISNWQCLHGRGPEPPNEEQRILQRIYVE
jgi:hypothetical protein